MSHFDALCADDADLAALRSAVRGFLVTDQRQFGWTPAVDCWLSSWDDGFSERLAEAGFVGLTIPVEYGGRGLGYLHRYVVTEELLAHGAPVGAHWIADRQVAPGLLTYGTDAQRTRLLPPIAEGRLHSCIGMSEHGAGSDLAAVQTRATRDGDGWVLNGTKVWTSGAHLAHQVVVLARTSPLDRDRRHAGFSQFIVPLNLPGITVSPIVLMNGEHHFNEVLFDDVRLTDDDVLGEIGDGWHQVTSELGFERSGPERFLSTATMLFEIVGACARHGVDARTATAIGDLMARMISLRQLSVSVARALTAGEDAGVRAALVKDLGTRFEQESVEVAAELIDGLTDGPDGARLRSLLATARVHSPLFTLRGGTNEVLRGVVAKSTGAGRATDAGTDELRQVVDQIGRRASDARVGRHQLPEPLDDELWAVLEASGLTRLTSDQDAEPAEAAVVLEVLARHCAAVPVAETDLLAAWLAGRAGLSVPADGPLAIAIAEGEPRDGRIAGTAFGVPWPAAGPIVLAVRSCGATYVAIPSGAAIPTSKSTVTHNLAGEPRGDVVFDLELGPAGTVVELPPDVGDELVRRGAWARCVQTIGAFDAAVALTTVHIGERHQFGRALNGFQTVQHSLAAMIGEVERSRAATALAIAAVADHGFDSPRAEYAVTVAKVAVGRAVGPVTTIAHQLHGAIGVTAEHQLWLATMRARSWADEFGTAGSHARRLGRMALTVEDPWSFVVGAEVPPLA